MLTNPVKFVLLFFTFSGKLSYSLVFIPYLQEEMPAFLSISCLFL